MQAKLIIRSFLDSGIRPETQTEGRKKKHYMYKEQLAAFRTKTAISQKNNFTNNSNDISARRSLDQQR